MLDFRGSRLDMLKEVRHLFARVFARVDDHLGALLAAFRDVLPGIRHRVVGKRERFFRSIGGYDDEFFRAPINFLYRALGNIETAPAHLIYFERSFLRAALGVVRHDFRAFCDAVPGILGGIGGSIGAVGCGSIDVMECVSVPSAVFTTMVLLAESTFSTAPCAALTTTSAA
jgi:hypothetical protein